jgi:hypothetical protein
MPGRERRATTALAAPYGRGVREAVSTGRTVCVAVTVGAVHRQED